MNQGNPTMLAQGYAPIEIEPIKRCESFLIYGTYFEAEYLLYINGDIKIENVYIGQGLGQYNVTDLALNTDISTLIENEIRS